MPGIFLNPSGCCCTPACVDGGTICVALVNTCPGDRAGVSVTITGTASASGTTDASGAYCASGLPVGPYTVALSKADCQCPGPFNVNVACDQTTGVSGVVKCDHVQQYTVCVYSCNSLPLPGAVCSFTGAVEGDCTTGDDGCCSLPFSKTGAYSLTVSHPTGRFTPQTFSRQIFNICTPASLGVTLPAAAGYVCCIPGTPFPCKATLLISDSQGGTTPIDVSQCGGSVCSMRMMDEVATTNAGVCPCVGGGFEFIPPPTLSLANALGWNLSFFHFGGPLLRQMIPIPNLDASGGSLLWSEACPDSGDCGPPFSRSNWRQARGCNTGTDAVDYGPFPIQFKYQFDGATTLWADVDSLYPFVCTFTFTPRHGFGPTPDPGVPFTPVVDGQVFALTAVVHE